MKEFTCYACGHEFVSTREYGAALEEFRANFPNEDEYGTICDECNEAFWEWMNLTHPEVERKV